MLEISLPLPADYRSEPILRYHGFDKASLTEKVHADGFDMALRLGGRAILLTVRLRGQAAIVTADAGADLEAAVVDTARRLLGLNLDGSGFEARRHDEPEIARLIEGRHGFRFPQTATVFDGLTRAILGQQVTVAFALLMRRELVALHGMAHASGLIAHPTAAEVATADPDQLRARKFSRSKVDYLLGVARAVAAGTLDLEGLRGLDPADAMSRLIGIRGIGPWTRNYILLRGCGFPDCAPIGDAGLAKGLQKFFELPNRPGPVEQETLMRRFAPHRSLATAHLWAGWS